MAIEVRLIRRDESNQPGHRGLHASMAGDPVRLAIGRPVIGLRVAVPHAETARQWEIARRAESARDSGGVRAIRLAAKGFAPKRLDQATRQRVPPGRAIHHVRAVTAATINGVARAGLGRCAGVADGTSRWWWKRALPQSPCLRRHKPNLRLPSSRPKARRSSPVPAALSDLDSRLVVRVPAGRPPGRLFLIRVRFNRRNRGKELGLTGVDDHGRAVTGGDSHGGHHLGRRHSFQGARDLLARRALSRYGWNPFGWRWPVATFGRSRTDVDEGKLGAIVSLRGTDAPASSARKHERVGILAV